jgi:hypothetical protein
MSWATVSRRWTTGWLGVGLALGLSACAHTLPSDAPLVDRVLGEKALRTQLVERGSADSHFVHEILHQLGQGPDGDQQFARLLVEHLGHHPTTARAVFQDLAAHRDFQEWVITRLRGQKEIP